MSKVSIGSITCTRCGENIPVHTYEYINSIEDSRLAELLVGRGLFTQVCPKCGETYETVYPTMYHLAEKNKMIMFAPDDECSKEYEESSQVFVQMGVDRRIVRSISDLIEKVNIFNADLRDTCVEVVKIMLFSRFYQEGKEVRHIYFDRVDGEDAIFDVDTLDGWLAVPVSIETIRGLAGDIPQEIDNLTVDVRTMGEYLKGIGG